jgi:4-aminobutyrate aminotransferase
MDGLKLVTEKYQDRVADVRGLGLMIGVEFVKDRRSLEPDNDLRDRIVMECFRRGLILLGCGESTVRFSPPLVIDAEQVNAAISTFSQSIERAIQASS